MKREGKTLRTLPAGDRRRMSDARNAWNKMTHEQRLEFIAWQQEQMIENGEHGLISAMRRRRS